MIVLSCFDGMSCGQIAFKRAGIKVEKYYASEIDKYAIKVTQSNYPDTIQLGSITEWQSWNIEKPDIIIGGSPCQGFSFAGKGLNFEDPRSALFFMFIDILKHFKPKYFLLENVIMKKEHNDVISSILGELYPECVEQTELFRTGRLEPIEINSALVSAQNRRRLYWTNIAGIKQPKDKGILLKDIIENATADKDKSYCLDANYWEGCSKEYSDLKGRRQLVSEIINHNSKDGLKCVAGINKNKKWLGDGKNLQRNFSQGERIYSVEGKSPTISAQSGGTAGPGNFLITGGAFRGRKPENPTSRESGLDTVQMLEIRDDEKTNTLTGVQKDNIIVVGHADIKGHDIIKRIYSTDGKAPTLTHIQGGNQEPKIEIENFIWRKLTPLECERLQTVPDNYTNHVSNSQRYKMLGNGWTVDVIAHIFKNIN